MEQGSKDTELSTDAFSRYNHYRNQLLGFYNDWYRIINYHELVRRISDKIREFYTFQLKSQFAIASLVECDADDLFKKMTDYQKSANKYAIKLTHALDDFIDEMLVVIGQVNPTDSPTINFLLSLLTDAKDLKQELNRNNLQLRLPSIDELTARVQALNRVHSGRLLRKNSALISNAPTFFTVYKSDKNLAHQEEEQEEKRP